jgi:hypothetical protein
MGVVVYVLYKVGTFFFKIGAASQQMRPPRDPKEKSKPSSKIKGGDYVDYEEVK